jgi:HEAT repeat protein
LITSLKDADAGVRAAAVLGLSNIGPPAAAALPTVRELLADKDPVVRKYAQAAVDRIQGSGS